MVAAGPVSRREELKGHIGMVAFSALVAGSFSFGGRIANQIDPMALTAVRFVLATLVVGVIAVATGQFTRAALRASWRYLLLGGLFGSYFVLMFEGLKTAHPVSTAAGFAWLIMGQVTNRRMAVALLFGAIGALWVIFRGNFAAFLAFDVGIGEMIFFVGCVAHALYIPLVPRLNRGEGVFAFALGTMVGGAALVGVFGASRIGATDWSALPVLVWAVLSYLVIFASVASVSLIQFASMRLKAAKVMAYTYLIPTWVILWELVLAGDVPPLVMGPGVGLTILALVMLLREGAAQPA